MRSALLVLLGSLVACAAPDRVAERGAGKPPYPAPTVSLRDLGEPVLTVTFRSAEGVPVSAEQPVVLTIGMRTRQAALKRGPARSVEPGGTVVDQAVYAVPEDVARQLRRMPPDSVRIAVHDGTQFWQYPYRNSDWLQQQ